MSHRVILYIMVWFNKLVVSCKYSAFDEKGYEWHHIDIGDKKYTSILEIFNNSKTKHELYHYVDLYLDIDLQDESFETIVRIKSELENL